MLLQPLAHEMPMSHETSFPLPKCGLWTEYGALHSKSTDRGKPARRPSLHMRTYVASPISQPRFQTAEITTASCSGNAL